MWWKLIFASSTCVGPCTNNFQCPNKSFALEFLPSVNWTTTGVSASLLLCVQTCLHGFLLTGKEVYMRNQIHAFHTYVWLWFESILSAPVCFWTLHVIHIKTSTQTLAWSSYCGEKPSCAGCERTAKQIITINPHSLIHHIRVALTYHFCYQGCIPQTIPDGLVGTWNLPLFFDLDQPTNQPAQAWFAKYVFAKVAHTTIVLGTPLPLQGRDTCV